MPIAVSSSADLRSVTGMAGLMRIVVIVDPLQMNAI